MYRAQNSVLRNANILGEKLSNHLHYYKSLCGEHECLNQNIPATFHYCQPHGVTRGKVTYDLS